MQTKKTVLILTNIEWAYFNNAHRTLNDLLREARRHKLAGDSLSAMQVLEEGVQACEAFTCVAGHE